MPFNSYSLPISENARRPKRPREPMGAAPPADSIPAARGVGRRIAADDTGKGDGIQSPLVEQYYNGDDGYWSMVSSDGFFIFEYPKITTYIDDDGEGVEYVVKHIDPDTPAP